MKSSIIAAALATLATAARINVSRRQSQSPVDVKIEMTGNTAVRATITNLGAAGLPVIRPGSIFDPRPIKKVDVSRDGQKVPFDGIVIEFDKSRLSEQDFQTIAPGESVTTDFDITDSFDLSSGGSFDIVASGTLAVAGDVESTTVSRVIRYSSNTVTVDVEAGVGAQTLAPSVEFVKRSKVQGCTGSKLNATVEALANCETMARQAQTAALSGPEDRMIEFFKSADNETRQTVAEVYERAAEECSSSNSGVGTVNCVDLFQLCATNVVSFARSSRSQIVHCDLFFEKPAQADKCYGTSQASTTLHEMTHLSQIGGTDDFDSYGYNAVRALDADENIKHADTYEMFAQAVRLDCPVRP